MAFKIDKRQKVRILNSSDSYLIGLIGRVESHDENTYSVMVGPYVIDFNKKDIELL